MYMVAHDEDVAGPANMPFSSVMHVKLVIYQNTAQDPGVAGSDENMLIMDALMDALEPSDVEEFNTLGGLVYNVQIEGSVFQDGGDLDGQGVLVVPIDIRLP